MEKKQSSIFLEKVGDTPQMRILEFFIVGKGLDYSKADILEETSMSTSTFYSHWSKLVDNEYVVKTRTAGKIELFTINEKNPYVKMFIEIFEQAVRDELSRQIWKSSDFLRNSNTSFSGYLKNSIDNVISETKSTKDEKIVSIPKEYISIDEDDTMSAA